MKIVFDILKQTFVAALAVATLAAFGLLYLVCGEETSAEFDRAAAMTEEAAE